MFDQQTKTVKTISPTVIDEANAFAENVNYYWEQVNESDAKTILNKFCKYRFWFIITMRGDFFERATIKSCTHHNCWRVFFRNQRYSIATKHLEVSPSYYQKYRNISPQPPTNFSKGSKEFINENGDCRMCSRCGGSGQLTCGKCSGDGTVRCFLCSGSGTVERSFTCSRCNGSGRITQITDVTYRDLDYGNARRGQIETSTVCYSCDGRGSYYRTVSCGSCSGRGYITCSNCGGSGNILCSQCDATGETYSVKFRTMTFWVDTNVKNHYGSLQDNIMKKHKGVDEACKTFIESNRPFSDGTSAYQVERRRIPLNEIKVTYENKEYTIYYAQYNNKFQWTGYPLDYKKITAALLISSSATLISLVAMGVIGF